MMYLVEPDDGPDCHICGGYVEWEDCWQCHGEGGFHDCGEDACCCLDKEELHIKCGECKGRGGYFVCQSLPHTDEQMVAFRKAAKMIRAEIEAARRQVEELGSLSTGNTRKLFAAYDHLAGVLDELLACDNIENCRDPATGRPVGYGTQNMLMETMPERRRAALSAARDARNDAALLLALRERVG